MAYHAVILILSRYQHNDWLRLASALCRITHKIYCIVVVFVVIVVVIVKVFDILL